MTTRRVMGVVVVSHGFGLAATIVGAVVAGARGGAVAARTRALMCHVINRVEFIHVINRVEGVMRRNGRHERRVVEWGPTPALRFAVGDKIHADDGTIGRVEFIRHDGWCCVQWPSGRPRNNARGGLSIAAFWRGKRSWRGGNDVI